MVLVPLHYSFSQRFSVPVEEAFRWAIDYDPDDYALMGLDGKRKIKKLADDTFILEDTRRTSKGLVTKTRLIRIDHERRAFTNTHVDGPTPHSQFWYEFFAEKEGGSRLDFTGLYLVPSKKNLSKEEVKKIAAEERRGDSIIWKSLARAMEADLKK